ncbi:MAG TPA: CopD family protein [Verrucomicrobiae bacterium]|jgi:putative copper resistance protein D|nr:CopD family protein [Verrucomicrobiae bacterium]
MIKLVDIFGYLAVLLSAATLVGQSLLIGGLLFLYWIASPDAEISADGLQRVRSVARTVFCYSAIGLAFIQVLYLYVNASVLMASAEISFREAAGANFFIAGSVMLFAAILIAIISRSRQPYAFWCLSLLVLIVLGASVATDHAASRVDGRVPLIALTAVHELATGFWIGGLPFLLVGLYVNRDSATQWYLTRRFSRVALISVILIIASGLLMSISYVGSWSALMGTAYGLMLLAKIAMLGAMLALGGVNFLMLRKYSPDETIPRLRRLVEAEVGIGITIILTAASMTSQPPAVDLVNDTVQFSHILERLKPQVPILKSPNTADLSTKIPGQTISKSDPTRKTIAYTSEGMPLSIRKIADMRWSEYNHHWMGLIVLAMGLLAFLARTGKAPWAEYWPLLMIGIAVFIFLRGDPECWPLGPKSFWSTWAQPEIFQHRAAAIVCIAFAIFELRVRRNPTQGSMLPLLFPLLCAVGAALLLTHSHGTSNVREETLAELSHTPMAVVGVMAGWSRWLELRLPENSDRRLSAWIWPICFIIIGAGLLNYREL